MKSVSVASQAMPKKCGIKFQGFLAILLATELAGLHSPCSAQFIGTTGGLRIVTYDPQSLYAKKAAESGTNNSGGGAAGSGGAAAAATDLALNNHSYRYITRH